MKMSTKEKRRIEKDVEREFARRKVKLTQEGERFSLNFSDWQNLTYNELCAIVYGHTDA
jgi:hypothetical protein